MEVDGCAVVVVVTEEQAGVAALLFAGLDNPVDKGSTILVVPYCVVLEAIVEVSEDDRFLE